MSPEEAADSSTWIYCEHGLASQCEEPHCAGADAYERELGERLRAARSSEHKSPASAGNDSGKGNG